MKKINFWKISQKLNKEHNLNFDLISYKLVLLSMLILVVSVGCNTSTDSYASLEGPKVYLVNEEENSLEGIDINLNEIVDQSKTNEIVDYIFILLSNGVSSSDFKPTITDVELIQYYNIEGTHITLNLNRAYYDLSFSQEIFLRASIVKSLTSFDAIDSVEFFVNGVPLIIDSSTALGRQYSSDVQVTYDKATSREVFENVVIYLPNEDKSRLNARYTTITLTPNKKLEAIVVEEILDNEEQILPNDVKLLNIYTHEGICFVDFSAEFQTALLPSGISERIAIYSLVNSLTELSNITNVQILVEGKKAATFQGTLSLNRIFTKNFSLIETDFGGD